MLEGQFYLRLLLIATFGVWFVFTMIKLGKRNPQDETSLRHIAFKVIGSFY